LKGAAAGAATRCLYFADRAFSSAESCRYEFPEEILEDLLKLERVAALWARPGGIGGQDLASKATELGLRWMSDVSATTTGGAKSRHYEFIWRGEKRRVGPHTRRDRGNGAGRMARIYLWKYEPEDPTERLLVVGVCGPKLGDSTTGKLGAMRTNGRSRRVIMGTLGLCPRGLRTALFPRPVLV
jgi:hypothetical protein